MNLYDIQVPQATFAAGQSLRDLPQSFGLGQLGKAHRHKLIPATETLAALFRPAPGHCGIIFPTINQI
jgi:hypothetical protein